MQKELPIAKTIAYPGTQVSNRFSDLGGLGCQKAPNSGNLAGTVQKHTKKRPISGTFLVLAKARQVAAALRFSMV